MNLPTLLVLLLVAAALFLALRAFRRGRGRCSCGSAPGLSSGAPFGGAPSFGAPASGTPSGGAPDGCTGRRSSACTGCPFCQGK